MAQVITFEDFQPSPRYDGNPWTEVQIEEASASTGPWTLIDTIAISPVDSDPRYPAVRSFTTEQASDAEGLWYRLVFFDATGDDALPTFPIQNVRERIPYATVPELAKILLINVTETTGPQLRRVLQSAAQEIDAEIGSEDINGDAVPYQNPPALVVEVNIERAVEHWQQMKSPFGVIGLAAETGPTGAFTGRNTWERHAQKLAPLKGEWGLA